MDKLRFLKPRHIAALLILTGGIVVLWLDVKTGLWQDIVILSGIVAGLFTFLMTALFIESWMAKAAHKRWQPVTRLALTDLLHALADEERSEISRGKIVARSVSHDDPEALLEQVVDERRRITEALARWSSFLAASADVQDLMTQIATLAEQLDAIRDAIIERECSAHGLQARDLASETAEFNRTVTAAIETIEALL